MVRDVDRFITEKAAQKLEGLVTSVYLFYLREGKRWLGRNATRRYAQKAGLTLYEAWWDLMGFPPVDVPPAMVLAEVARPALSRYVYYRWRYPRAQVLPSYLTLREATDRLLGPEVSVARLLEMAHERAVRMVWEAYQGAS